MVRKDGDTMKECMKTNNPTEFRDAISADERFNKAMDAYEKENNINIGIDLSHGPDMTTTPKQNSETAFCLYPAKVVNTTYSVNLRAEPSLDSAIITHIHPDTEFFMSATRSPDWYKVRLKDGTEGYASSKFVARVMPDEHT